MRYRHSCPKCNEQFSRRWNMERHVRRNHILDMEDWIFYAQKMRSKNSTFKTQSPNRNISSNIFSPFYLLNNILPNTEVGASHKAHSTLFDTILEMLRKTSEFKKLRNELSLTTMGGYPVSYPSSGMSTQGGVTTSDKLPNLQNLEIAGFIGYICIICWVAHPLAIYRYNYLSQAKPIMSFHKCKIERIKEVQQHQQRLKQPLYQEIKRVENLCANELPQSMLEAVREWTNGRARLMTGKIPALSESFQDFILFTENQQWAARAVKDGFTVLTDEELSDFIHKVRNSTFVVAKVKESGPAYFMCLG